MPTVTVDSYADLQQRIKELPPSGDGRLRVYRGQTTEYPKILSSFGRVREGSFANVSSVFFQHMFIKEGALNVLGDLKNLPHYDFFDLKIAAGDYYMAEALVQHYGCQTRYIDATPSLDTALWFSTHRFQCRADDPIGDKAPFRLTLPAWHDPPSKGGVLYVIDVKRWERGTAISEGDYIDLVEIAPEGVNRPRRQTGGILYAPGSAPDHDDVSRFVTGKFTINFPWTETGKDWDTDYLFPTPEEDEIYRRLLQSPFLRTVRQQPGAPEEVIWRRSCALPEYYGDPADPSRRQLYRSFDKALKPTLYYGWLMYNLDGLQTNPLWQSTSRASFEPATPILLDRPRILFSTQRGGPHPPPAHPPENVPPLFRNFLLEYSPEQFTCGYDESRMARALWCCWRAPDEFSLQSFGTLDGKPRGSDISVYKWQSDQGLVCTGGPDLMGSFVTLPLDLIRLTAEGALDLRAPDATGHHYVLTTNEKFWTEVSNWTDLL